jgi:hypothetical protein
LWPSSAEGPFANKDILLLAVHCYTDMNEPSWNEKGKLASESQEATIHTDQGRRVNTRSRKEAL